MYHQFNIHRFYFLPAQCIYVSCVDLRTNSNYFPILHQLTVLYTWDGVCLLRGTSCIIFMAVGRRPFTVEPGFDTRSVHMRFLVVKQTLGQIFSPPSTSVFLSVSFPPILRTHLSYTSLLLEGQRGEAWEPSKKQCSLGNHGALDRKVLSLIGIWRVNAENQGRCCCWQVAVHV